LEQASVELDLAIVHSTLTDFDLADLSTNGKSMTVEEALALALGGGIQR
jgi:hypothetical protein